MKRGMEWDTSPEDAIAGAYDAYVAWVHSAVYMVCQSYAPLIENWMKQNAPWTDRTGNARQSLNTDVNNLASSIVISLAHGVDYGFWLETRFAGRFSIIAPAIDHFVPLIMADIQRLLS